jgi:hypothetical protein
MNQLLATLDLRYCSSAEDAQALYDNGYEPVECSLAAKSVIGPLKLDHHDYTFRVHKTWGTPSGGE